MKPVKTNRRRKLGAWLDAQVAKFGGTATARTVSAVDFSDDVAATGTLTITAEPTAGETVTIGLVTYHFVDSLNEFSLVPQVLRTGDVGVATQSLLDAINLTEGGDGANYINAPTNQEVTATGRTDTTLTVTAKAAGTSANSIATTETLAFGSWGGATLSGGANGNFLTSVAHGFTSGDGPYEVFSTIALPSGLTSGVGYYVGVLDANTFELFLDADSAGQPGVAAEVDMTDAGSGTITVGAQVTDQSIVEHMRDGETPNALANSTDIDDFA
ncbi:gp68 [Alphaproteobacteria phage PhiJL001]|uniref:Gp68 n=1 Tax=Alphaproteobacteria phage PhiJL001 TaxID=2681607 RepID=Q5DN37_9CAUD|nr:gp68 [Alphaproteobacteria phage PhiJL001]AAT69544.1 gp68 [Alphaproteobacteria phage PhiJL001]